jgi:hypothetical protein
MKLQLLTDWWRVRNPSRRTSHPRRQRARAAVTSAILFVCVLSAGLAILVETKRPQWRDPEYFHRQKALATLAKMNTNSGVRRPLVVLLGSSRPQMGFSPEHAAHGYGDHAPHIYNLSQSGCQPLGQWLNWNRLHDAGVVPDLLLLELLPATLGERKPLETQLPLSRFSLTDLQRASPHFTASQSTRAGWLLSKLASWYSLRFDLLAHAKLASITAPQVRQEFLWADMRPNGWSPFYPAEWSDATRQRQHDRVRNQFEDYFERFELRSDILDLQKKLLRACGEKKVRVAIVLMPESRWYRSIQSERMSKQIDAYLHSLRTEFDVPIYDCRTWIDEETAYSDGYHLLGPGGEQFSRRFGADCLRDLLPIAK